MTQQIADQLTDALVRADGQEDVILALYRPSRGAERFSALLYQIVPPGPRERLVHGNASFTGRYVLRAARLAAATGAGVVMLHTHPKALRWQELSGPDFDAERSYARLAYEFTALPLVGMTLAAGDGTWSARAWSPGGRPLHAENVRVIGERLSVSWNDRVRPVPASTGFQVRTRSAWGDRTQQDLARLRVLVVGVGSVGLDVATRLAAAGIEHVGVMDFDVVEPHNLDRLIGATRGDAARRRPKARVAARLVRQAGTAATPRVAVHEISACSPGGHAIVLDYDLVFSCVDRPWPRGVLNLIAHADLVPVIDGGIAIDPFEDGLGMRNATWRAHVIRPGRPCLACNGQLDLSALTLDREGLLDDPAYISGSRVSPSKGRENVALLSASVSAALLGLFVSFTVAPGGIGEPGPLRHVLSTHMLEHMPVTTRPHCPIEAQLCAGDRRTVLTGPHAPSMKRPTSRLRRLARQLRDVYPTDPRRRPSDRTPVGTPEPPAQSPSGPLTRGSVNSRPRVSSGPQCGSGGI